MLKGLLTFAPQEVLFLAIRDRARNLPRLRWRKTQPPKSPLSGGLVLANSPLIRGARGVRKDEYWIFAQPHKGYCVNPAKTTIKRKGCHDATIKKGKDAKKDGWLSAMRSPYERVFAHRNRRVRYRGLQKVQFQPGIRTLTFNLKRVITLGFENINLVPA